MKSPLSIVVFIILIGTSVYASEISFERPEGYEEMLAKYPKSEADLIGLIYEAREAMKVSKNSARQQRIMNNFTELIDSHLPFEGWIGTICDSDAQANGNGGISYTINVEIANYTLVLTAGGYVTDESEQEAILGLIDEFPVGAKVNISGEFEKVSPTPYYRISLNGMKRISKQELTNAMRDFMGIALYDNMTEQYMELLFCPVIELTRLSLLASTE